VFLHQRVDFLVLPAPSALLDCKNRCDHPGLLGPVRLIPNGAQNHCHAGITVGFSPRTVFCKGLVQPNVGDKVAMDENEVTLDQTPLVEIA
jgi:hypothetical protein